MGAAYCHTYSVSFTLWCGHDKGKTARLKGELHEAVRSK
jgi:hypothetical protein